MNRTAHNQAQIFTGVMSLFKHQQTTAILQEKDEMFAIGRFSETGLLERMRFVIFRARSRALPGRFLSRCCFTLCITVEAEPRIAKQYKCQYCCSCKNYRGKGMEVGKKCLCVVFLLTRRSRIRGKNAFWGILYSTSNRLLLVARHILSTGLQKCL